MAVITIYRHENFSGEFKDFSVWVSNLEDESNGVLGNWNDETSSIWVHSGTWQIYADHDYKGATDTLKPGKYPNMHNLSVKDNQLTSFKIISE